MYNVGSPVAITAPEGPSIIWKATQPVKQLSRRFLKYLRCSPVILAVTAGMASPAFAGAWVQPPGGYFAKFSGSYLYTDTELDANGNEVPLLQSNELVRSAAYREVALSTYVEYGLHERFTVLGSLPFKIATSRRTEISEDASLVRDVDVTNAGWSDLFVGGRGALLRGRRPAAVEAGLKIPLGYEAIPENGGPALGTAEVDFEVALLAGFAARHVYASARGAYRVAGGSLDDQIGFSAEIGGVHQRIFAQALVEGWYTTGEIETLDVSSTTQVPNQDLLKLIATVGFRTGAHTSVAAEVYHVLDGRNTPAGTTVALGLAFKAP
jgi:hypothetical protein